jgi:hypothetical protein
MTANMGGHRHWRTRSLAKLPQRVTRKPEDHSSRLGLMNGTTLLSTSIVALVFVSACQPGGTVDTAAREAEVESLRAILESDRQAHLETDAPRLVSNLADTLTSRSPSRPISRTPSTARGMT